MLQSDLNILLPWMREMIKTSVVLEYIPRSWSIVTVVYSRKPERMTVYSITKSFKPISLTSFLIKHWKKYINRHLTEEVFTSYESAFMQEKRHFIPLCIQLKRRYLIKK